MLNFNVKCKDAYSVTEVRHDVSPPDKLRKIWIGDENILNDMSLVRRYLKNCWVVSKPSGQTIKKNCDHQTHSTSRSGIIHDNTTPLIKLWERLVHFTSSMCFRKIAPKWLDLSRPAKKTTLDASELPTRYSRSSFRSSDHLHWRSKHTWWICHTSYRQQLMYDSGIHCFSIVQTPPQIPDVGVLEEGRRLTTTVYSERESLGYRVHHLSNQLPWTFVWDEEGKRVEAIYDSPISERASWLIMQASPCCTASHAHISSMTAPAEDEKRRRIVGSHSCKVTIQISHQSSRDVQLPPSGIHSRERTKE